MIEYTWQCNDMKVIPTQGDLTEVVAVVSWHLNGTDGTYQDNQYGQVTVAPPNPDNFSAFSDLTLDTVIQWVKTELGEDTVKSLQDKIAASIDNRANPPYVVRTSPWYVAPHPAEPIIPIIQDDTPTP